MCPGYNRLQFGFQGFISVTHGAGKGRGVPVAQSEAREPQAPERCRLRVEGRVQGVGFRAWTAWRARDLGLRGWVRNRPDGSVELEAEGRPAELSRLREDVRHGPPGARVSSVRDLDPSRDPLTAPFEVRY